VADVNGKSPDLSNLELPDDEMAPVELAAELPEAEAPPIVVDQQDDQSHPDEEATAAGEKPDQVPQYIEWGGMIGIPVLLLILALMHLIYFATAVYLISIGFVGYGIWKNRETSSIYIVLLGCALIAILTALYCLWIELGRYDFNIRAKQPLTMVRTTPCGTSFPTRPAGETS
jgi:hypothetical protein